MNPEVILLRLLGPWASLLQFLPLCLFVCVAFLHGEPQADDWLKAFLAGGAMAGLQLLLAKILFRHRPLGRLILGVNMYVIFGSVAVLVHQEILLQVLDDLRERGVFLSIFMVCIIASTGFGDGFWGQKTDFPVHRRSATRFGFLL